MAQQDVILTQEGLKELQEKLEHLKTVGRKETAEKILSETFSLIDTAVSKGTLQKATANRKKARLSLYANK